MYPLKYIYISSSRHKPLFTTVKLREGRAFEVVRLLKGVEVFLRGAPITLV